MVHPGVQLQYSKYKEDIYGVWDKRFMLYFTKTSKFIKTRFTSWHFFYSNK